MWLQMDTLTVTIYTLQTCNKDDKQNFVTCSYGIFIRYIVGSLIGIVPFEKSKSQP